MISSLELINPRIPRQQQTPCVSIYFVYLFTLSGFRTPSGAQLEKANFRFASMDRATTNRPMARRKRNPTSSRRRAPRKTPPTEPAPLLVIDQKPILKKALAQCRRLRTELNKKQARLREFEEEEMAAYQRWYSAEFGARLTELRELRESLQDHEFVADQMGWCEMCRPDKLAEVFEELMQRLEAGTLHAFEPPPPDHPEEDEEDDEDIFDDDDDDDDIFGLDDDKDIFEDMEEAFKAAFDSFFGFSDDDEATGEDEHGRREHGLKHRGHKKPQSPEAAAIKTLYRTLAKRLHPDHSDLEELLRERRWHELQKAYDEQDLAALQRIEAVCDMEDAGGLSIKLGLARLRDLAAYQRSHVQPIRDALRQAKRHPAFNFAKTDTGILREEIKFDLNDQLRQCLDRRDWLRGMFEEVREDLAEDAAMEKPEVQSPQDDDGRDDFWDNYTAWRDEELRRKAGQ